MADKKESKPVKAAPTHPPYVEMIKEAIVTLKERNGSSQQALKKFIGNKYTLPAGWEKMLGIQLKRLVANESLTKVKASYKLGETLKKAPAKPKKAVVKKAAAPAAKPKAEKPKAKEVAKPKKAPKKATPAKAKPEKAKSTPSKPAKSPAKVKAAPTKTKGAKPKKAAAKKTAAKKK